MEKVRELCSLIHLKYDSEAACARALGWSKQRLNRITNGEREPDIYEAAELAVCLETDVAHLAQIFLRYKSPYGDYGSANTA